MIQSINIIYADLIEKGLKTIDQVPIQNREAVQTILDERKAAREAISYIF